MRRKDFLRFTAVGIGAAAVAALTGCGGGGDDPGTESIASAEKRARTAASGTAPAASTLSPEEVAALRYMREEEKLAHDVYVALHDTWGLQVFSNIAVSETKHTEAILRLLTKYGLEDPAAGKLPGEFEDPALADLYGKLVASGRTNAIEALRVGALIEETDIRDIHEKKAITDNQDIVEVYGNLLCGSGNHLRAFNAQLLARGITYVPQVITQAEWDAVASGTGTNCED